MSLEAFKYLNNISISVASLDTFVKTDPSKHLWSTAVNISY